MTFAIIMFFTKRYPIQKYPIKNTHISVSAHSFTTWDLQRRKKYILALINATLIAAAQPVIL